MSTVSLSALVVAACTVDPGQPAEDCPDGPNCPAGDGDGDADGDGDSPDGTGGNGGGAVGDGDGDGGAPSCPLARDDARDFGVDLQDNKGAVGRLLLPDDEWCAATLIDVDKVMTAASCVEQLEPQQIRFEPQYGIAEAGVAPTLAWTATRIVQGRDAGDTEPYADWAIVEFGGIDYADELGATYRTMVPTALPELPRNGVTSIGYDEDLFVAGDGTAGRPVVRDCDLLALDESDGASPLSTCDVLQGAIGGPIYRMAGSVAQLVGINAASDVLACETKGAGAPNVASGDWFSGAPLRAHGIAVAPDTGDGLMVVVRDTDARTTHVRQQSGDTFEPWRVHDFEFTGDNHLTAGEDEFGGLLIVNVEGDLGGLAAEVSRRAPDEDEWSTRTEIGFSPLMVDIDLSGTTGTNMQMFYITSVNAGFFHAHGRPLGAMNWSGGTQFEYDSSVNALSAEYFDGEHIVVTVGDNGAEFLHGNTGDYTGPVDFGQEAALDAVAVTTISETRMGVFFATSDGELRFQSMDAGGRAVSSSEVLIAEPPFRVDSFVELDAGRDADGVVHLFAIGDDGNVYTIRGGADADSYSKSWERFYK